jgi:hypothetical protein
MAKVTITIKNGMPEVDLEIKCEKHDRIMSSVANVQARVFKDDEPRWTMHQCLVQACTRYYCESLGGYLTRSENGTLVPVVPIKTVWLTQ